VAIYDAVGVPFPKSAPAFTDDKKVLYLIKRIEYDIEIKADLEECIAAIKGIAMLLTKKQDLIPTIGFSEFFALSDGAVSHAVHLYAKAFNGNKRRRRLDATKYFKTAPANLQSAHQFFVDFRNQFFAHAEMRINEHTLYVLPSESGLDPRTNVYSQIQRTILCESYQWSHLENAAEFICECLTTEIAENSKKLDERLSTDQKELINSMKRFGVKSLGK
jgi:hypothetical protein